MELRKLINSNPILMKEGFSTLRSLRIRCEHCVKPNFSEEKICLWSQAMIKAFLIFLLFPFSLSAQTYKPENPIQFKIKNAGITVDGTISDWELEVNFDAKKLTQSSIKGTANPASIDTGIKLRDKHMQGRQYFYTEKFPLIHLTSKSFTAKGKNAFTGIFELQIRHIMKEVEIPFTLTHTGKKRKFKGEFVIDRLDLGLGEKSLVLSDEVRVVVEF